jgi:DNA repair exonuclease SbcCD nuclease subunit
MTTTIGIISDIHVSPAGTPPTSWHNAYALDNAGRMLGTAVERCRAERVDAVVLLGDLAHTGDLESIAAVIRETSALECPIHMVPGNHDFHSWPDVMSGAIRNEGETPFILAPMTFPIKPGLRVATMALERDAGQRAFHGSELPDVTASTDALVLFTHFPVLETQSRLLSHALAHPGDLHNRLDLERALLVRGAPAIVIHGHLHVRDAHCSGPVLQLACAALIEPPHEVTFIEIERMSSGDIVVTRRAEPVAEPAQPVNRLPVLAPGTQTWTYAGGAWSDISGD